jgi:mannobiose 2-epimerase
MEKELRADILPFWLPFIDRERGGFYGWIGNDRSVKKDSPKGLVMHSRFLWTYASAYRRIGGDQWLDAAKAAYGFLTEGLADKANGGFWWAVESSGAPVFKEKIIYGQAFAIYGLSEYYRATGDAAALSLALETFSLLERAARDPLHGGYAEAVDQGFTRPIPRALSENDIACAKSMNTNLHVMEALTALLLASGLVAVRDALRDLVRTFVDKVFLGPEHLGLYFGSDWSPMGGPVSYGHDIESCWLIAEASEAAWGHEWPAGIREKVLSASAAALSAAQENGGAMPNELHGERLDTDRIWWVQAETVVGMANAYQMTGKPAYLAAAERQWGHIEDRQIDRKYGEWFWNVRADGAHDPAREKGGMWKTCYHNGRACMEIMERAAKER